MVREPTRTFGAQQRDALPGMVWSKSWASIARATHYGLRAEKPALESAVLPGQVHAARPNAIRQRAVVAAVSRGNG